jgi:hypothetical protein
MLDIQVYYITHVYAPGRTASTPAAATGPPPPAASDAPPQAPAALEEVERGAKHFFPLFRLFIFRLFFLGFRFWGFRWFRV